MKKHLLLVTASLVLVASLALGAADWSKPVGSDLYTSVLSTIRDNFAAAATWFEAGDPANLPVGAKKINTSTKRIQRWDGSAWQDWAVYQLAGDMTTAATASKGVLRDASGRAKVADGAATDDVATVGQSLLKTGGSAARLNSGAALEFADATRWIKGSGNALLLRSAGSLVTAAHNYNEQMVNAEYDPETGNSNRIDTSYPAYMLDLSKTDGLNYYTAPAGANPIVWQARSPIFHLSNVIQISANVGALYGATLYNASAQSIKWLTVSIPAGKKLVLRKVRTGYNANMTVRVNYTPPGSVEYTSPTAGSKEFDLQHVVYDNSAGGTTITGLLTCSLVNYSGGDLIMSYTDGIDATLLLE